MTRNVWIGLVASVVVVAAAVALALALRAPGIELPDEVDGLVALDSEEGTAEREDAAEAVERQRRAFAYAADEVSAAFGDADAAVRTYTDPGSFERLFQVTAVADDAGPLLPEAGFDDPEQRGTAFPRTERVERDDVECLVTRETVSADAAGDPDDSVVSVLCQRSSGSLTVRAGGASDAVAPVADLVDALWAELD